MCHPWIPGGVSFSGTTWTESWGEVAFRREIVGSYFQEKEWILGSQTTNEILVSL